MTTVEEILKGKPDTVGKLFDWRVEKTPYATAFRFRDPHDAWISLNWKETGELVDKVAAGLLSLGLGYEQRVAIVATTRIEWILADLGVSKAGGVTTAIYPTTAGDDFYHILSDSDSGFLIAENSDQLLKVLQYPEVNDQIHKIILLDGEYRSDKVISWEDFLSLGEQALAEETGILKKAAAKITGETLATLVYTSGTTGVPKGVELLHSCWTYEAWSVETLNLIGNTETLFLWLPLSHVFGKDLVVIQLAIGFISAVDGRIPMIVPGMGEIGPDVMCGAPRIFEKVRSTVMLSFPRNSIKGRIARWAFAVGRESRPYRLAGKSLPLPLKIAYGLADKLVFSKLKKQMGGNIGFLISGSAKLSSKVQGWFYSAGILVIEGYGLTETTAIACVPHPSKPRFGTVGPPLPGTDIKVATDGEILIKGPCVMRGYHKRPDLTAEVIDEDGYLHTGDIGKIDEAGYVIITDRKKDLLKTSGGKYVAPAKVEAVIAASVPYVSQVVCVGDGRKYVSALLTLERDTVLRWADRRGFEGQTYEQIIESEVFLTTIGNYIKRANGQLERWETVKRFHILPNEFGVHDGGVTPSLKIRRATITKYYADIVSSLYDEEQVAGDEGSEVD